MKIDRTHGFSPEEALERIQALAGYWSAKYGVKIDWNGSTGRVSGKVRGVKFDGTMRVEADRLSADIKAGFLAEKLGGKKYVEGKIADYLDPAHSVESLRARIP